MDKINCNCNKYFVYNYNIHDQNCKLNNKNMVVPTQYLVTYTFQNNFGGKKFMLGIEVIFNCSQNVDYNMENIKKEIIKKHNESKKVFDNEKTDEEYLNKHLIILNLTQLN